MAVQRLQWVERHTGRERAETWGKDGAGRGGRSPGESFMRQNREDGRGRQGLVKELKQDGVGKAAGDMEAA